MKLTPDQRRIARTILEHPSDSFVALVHIAGLDPKTSFVGSDLRGVDFGTDDLAGFDFSKAHLEGANLLRARGLSHVMFDAFTVWPDGMPPLLPPPDFVEQSKHMILRGLEPPKAWQPYILELDFQNEQGLCDASPLSGLKNLRTLRLNGTGIRDISPLGGLVSMRYLYLSATRTADLRPLGNLRELQYLHLAGTDISSLEPIEHLTNLQYLDLCGTGVGSVKPLAGLAALQYLDLSRTRVKDLRPLSRLFSLEYLGLSGSRARDTAPISTLKNLQHVELNDIVAHDEIYREKPPARRLKARVQLGRLISHPEVSPDSSKKARKARYKLSVDQFKQLIPASERPTRWMRKLLRLEHLGLDPTGESSKGVSIKRGRKLLMRFR